jgi:S-ribosylhomocysteine lyase
MKKISSKIESFTLDHTLVKAPYVRLIGRETGPKGDVIANFDIRLTQPNVQMVDPSALHTIEHSAAGLLRDYFAAQKLQIRLIDSSPFGCLTGFHNIIWEDTHYADDELVQMMINAWVYALEEVLTFTEADVPAMTEKECGNAAMHSLHGAKIWARRILDQKFSRNAFERDL